MDSSFARLKDFLTSFASVPVTEWLHALPLFKLSRLDKGEFFFRQGQSFQRIGLLVSGLVNTFYLDSEGDIHVKRFIGPGKPVAPYPSVVTGEVATYNLQALEKSLIAHIAYSDYQELLERHMCWERITRKSLEQEIMEKDSKEYDLFMLSAEERYESFLKRHPSIAGKIPQYLIASYIGITPVALSRIRGQRVSGQSNRS